MYEMNHFYCPFIYNVHVFVGLFVYGCGNCKHMFIDLTLHSLHVCLKICKQNVRKRENKQKKKEKERKQEKKTFTDIVLIQSRH